MQHLFSLFRLLFDWSTLLELAGWDAVLYAVLAVVGTLAFMLRMGLALLLGVEGDVDMEVDGDLSEGGDFGLLSVLSVTAFLMGVGWTGLISRLEWELGPTPSALAAIAVGTAFMFLAAGLMFFLRRAQHEVIYNPSDAVGKTGMVYMSIPAAGDGTGKVRVAVQGRSVLVDAVSKGDAIASFRDVKVVGTRDEKTLFVEPS